MIRTVLFSECECISSLVWHRAVLLEPGYAKHEVVVEVSDEATDFLDITV